MLYLYMHKRILLSLSSWLILSKPRIHHICTTPQWVIKRGGQPSQDICKASPSGLAASADSIHIKDEEVIRKQPKEQEEKDPSHTSTQLMLKDKKKGIKCGTDSLGQKMIEGLDFKISLREKISSKAPIAKGKTFQGKRTAVAQKAVQLYKYVTNYKYVAAEMHSLEID